MKKLFLTVEYDGTAYSGWQRQINGPSVQQTLEEALSSACGHDVRITGASRTDAGVHALAQAFCFDTGCTIPPDKFPFVLNNMLPPDIRVHSGREVPPAFHPRFLACGKTYTYRICNSRHGTAIRRNTHFHVPVPLDDSLMREALSLLPGTHDFAAFQASGGTAKTTVRTVYSADLSRKGDNIEIVVSGNAFLYNMVRIIAGTLVEVGLGKRGTGAFALSYSSLNRLDLGMTAPAHGLELTEVRYPPAAFTDPESLRWHQEVLDASDQ